MVETLCAGVTRYGRRNLRNACDALVQLGEVRGQKYLGKARRQSVSGKSWEAEGWLRVVERRDTFLRRACGFTPERSEFCRGV